MNEQEIKDLEEVKVKVDEIKLHTWDYLRLVSKYTEIDMISSGYRSKTKAEAMKEIFDSTQKKIDKLINNYVKKYPD